MFFSILSAYKVIKDDSFTSFWGMVFLRCCTWLAGICKATTSRVSLCCSWGTKGLVLSCSRRSATHLHNWFFTLFVGAPSSSCKIVTPHVDYAPVLLFLSLLHDHCLQMGNSAQDSIQWRFFVPMEDVVLHLAFIVIIFGEKENLSLSASLLVDILFSRINQSESFWVELKSSGTECEIQLSDEFFIGLSEASAVVSHHGFLQLYAALAHYLLDLAKSNFVYKLVFESTRYRWNKNHLYSLEWIVLKIQLHFAEYIVAFGQHFCYHPVQGINKIFLVIKIFQSSLFSLLFLFLFFVQMILLRSDERAIVIPICVLPNCPICQMMIAGANNHP